MSFSAERRYRLKSPQANDGVVFAWSVTGDTVDAASQRVLGKHTGAISGIAAASDGRWFA